MPVKMVDHIDNEHGIDINPIYHTKVKFKCYAFMCVSFLIIGHYSKNISLLQLVKSHHEAQISILINTLEYGIVGVATFSTCFVLVEILSAETVSLHTSIFLTFNVFSYSHLLITKIILTPETLSWLFLSTSMYFHFLTINVFSCSHFFNC